MPCPAAVVLVQNRCDRYWREWATRGFELIAAFQIRWANHPKLLEPMV